MRRYLQWKIAQHHLHLTHKVDTSLSCLVDLDAYEVVDIRSVTDILLTVASLLSLASVFSAILLAYDWIATLVKQHASRALPISTRTLKMQSIILMVLTIWLFAILIPSTVFSRTRSARTDESTCTTHDLPIQANPVYWNHGFCEFN